MTERLRLDEFRANILTAMLNKPKEWRDGQFVFNYIDEMYGVARSVQFMDGVDCFYNDGKIDEFIDRCYIRLVEILNQNYN
jgi:hypothetical protein